MTHPIEAACREAAAKLLALRFHNCALEPRRHDRDETLKDIEAIAAVLDPFLEALGQYTQDHFGMTARQMDGCHENVLHKAMVDDGLSDVVDQQFEQIVRDRMDDAFLGRVA